MVVFLSVLPCYGFVVWNATMFMVLHVWLCGCNVAICILSIGCWFVFLNVLFFCLLHVLIFSQLRLWFQSGFQGIEELFFWDYQVAFAPVFFELLIRFVPPMCISFLIVILSVVIFSSLIIFYSSDNIFFIKFCTSFCNGCVWFHLVKKIFSCFHVF